MRPFRVVRPKIFYVRQLGETPSMSATYSETLFEEYCQENHIVCTRVSVSSERSPDFQIQIGQTLVVCEVKQIDMNESDRKVLAMVNSGIPTSFYVVNRVRSKLKDVSAQLKDAALAGIPTMVVLYNNSPVYDYTGYPEILQAMFGQKSSNVTFSAHQDSGPVVSPPFFGGNRGLGPRRNTSVSVVAVLKQDSAGRLQLCVYHNPHGKVPLDPAVFSEVAAVQPVVPDTEDVEL